jgi:hypothetical protein
MLIAASVCGEVFGFRDFLSIESFQFIYIVLVFCLPGWLLAAPVVLAVTDFHGWRLWFFLAVGSCIGPIVMVGFALWNRLSDGDTSGFYAGWRFLVLAAAVSCTTTLIYLWLIRRAEERSNSAVTEVS